MVHRLRGSRRHRLAARATRRSAGLAALVVAAIVIAQVLVLGPFAGMDFTQLDLGVLCAIRRALGEGEGLLLSRAIGLGGPLLFEPHAQLFYPLRWLALALPPPWDLTLSPLVHLSLIAGGTAWLLRTHTIGPRLACLLGIATASSGVMLDLIQHTIYIVGGAYLPFVWASARRVLQRRCHPLVPGAFLLCLLLGGEAQAFGIGVALILVEGVRGLRGVRRAPADAMVMAAGCAAALLCGLTLWLPLLGEAQLGASVGMSADQVMARGLTPALALGAIWPNVLLLEHGSRELVSLVLREGELSPWNLTPYVGALLLALAASALWLRHARVPLVGGVVLSLLAFGPLTPLLPLLLSALPVLQRFRYPAKFLPAAVLALVVCAALSLRAADRSRAQRRRVAVTLGVVACACLAGRLFTTGIASAILGSSSALSAAELDALGARLATVAWWPLAVVALALLAWAHHRRTLLVGFVLVADLVLSGVSTVHNGPPLHDLGNAHIAPLAARGLRAGTVCAHGSAYRLQHAIPGVDRRWAQAASYVVMGAPETQACAGQASAASVSAASATRTQRALASHLAALPPAAGWALACDRVVFAAGDPAGSLPLDAADTASDTIRVRELERAPDAFAIATPMLAANEDEVVRRVARATSQAEALSILDVPLAQTAWSGVVRAHSVDVERAHDAPFDITAATLEDHGGTRLAVLGASRGVYGVRTSYRAGWHAYLEGKEVPTVRIAGQLLGAVVDTPKASDLRFVYRPPHLGGAVACAATGLALFAALLVLQARRGRARRPAP